MAEKYITDAQNNLKNKVDDLLEELKDFANDNDLQLEWVMETFANMFSYKVSQICKERKTMNE